MKTIGQITAVVLSVVIFAIMGGFVLMKLWNWIIVPIFALNELTFIQAIALSVFVGYVKAKGSPEEKNDKGWEEKLVVIFVYAIVLCSIFLLFGWIAHLLIV